ncbi:hypothetical protein IJ732_00970, partial [bacterium]|nr:hypothetical protein [bacterium]
DVCLTDGSSYSYECDETKCTGIIIDTNGDKKPNSAGKDRYRMLVTNKGLIAQGESEYCGTIDGGLDCGKYILTYHKLFDGLINNCTAYDNGQCSQCENGYQNNGNSCKDIRENTCSTYSGTTCTKCTSENLLVDGECISMTSLKCQASTDGKTCSECTDGNALSMTGTCIAGKVVNGTTLYKFGDYYGKTISRRSAGDYIAVGGSTASDYWGGAYEDCEAQGLELPDTNTLKNMLGSANNDNTLYGNDEYYWTSDKVPGWNCGKSECVHYAYKINEDGTFSESEANDYAPYKTLCVEKTTP